MNHTSPELLNTEILILLSDFTQIFRKCLFDVHGSSQNRMSLAYVDQACNRYDILLEQGQLQLCWKKRKILWSGHDDKTFIDRRKLRWERDSHRRAPNQVWRALSQSSYGETCKIFYALLRLEYYTDGFILQGMHSLKRVVGRFDVAKWVLCGF